MRKPFRKALVLTAGTIVIALIAGCQEENISDTKSNTARIRLLATRNRELNREINTLKKQHKNELIRRQKLLDKCLREKEAVAKTATESVQDLMNTALKNAPEEMTKLYKENQNLNSQIQKLQTENDNLRKQITQLKKELGKKPTIPDKPQNL